MIITHIEDLVEEILKSLKVEYKKDFPIGIHSVDFYLPKYRIAIEVDGNIWHKNKWKTEQRDKIILLEGVVDNIYHFQGNRIFKQTKEIRNDIRKILRK